MEMVPMYWGPSFLQMAIDEYFDVLLLYEILEKGRDGYGSLVSTDVD